MRLENVTVRFDASEAASSPVLDDVTIHIKREEFVSLVGMSGCGKTTILNLVSGLLRPSSGAVEVLGNEPAASRSKVGYMFASDALIPWRTVQKNVEYGLELRGIRSHERREIANDFLDLVGLSHVSQYWPWQLSQGMRQRVALARTWAIRPEVLLMDEPFSALDALTRQVLQAEFLSLWEKHRTTVLFVTHDIAEAIFLSDRVMLLGNGKVLIDVNVPFPRPRNFNDLQSKKTFQAIRQNIQERII